MSNVLVTGGAGYIGSHAWRLGTRPIGGRSPARGYGWSLSNGLWTKNASWVRQITLVARPRNQINAVNPMGWRRFAFWTIRSMHCKCSKDENAL